MRTAPIVSLLALLCSGPALCQLPQLHPELCGTPNGAISLPSEISATKGAGLEVDVSLRRGAPSVRVPDVYEVEEVCPLRDGRFVVFGNMMSGMSFSIVEPANPLPVDTDRKSVV